LVYDGYSNEDADLIVDAAAAEISSLILEAVSTALQHAESLGEKYNASDFLNELNIVQTGSYFMITTDSGKTDYSEPPFPMLPGLLKRAKIAKDGSLYKVIPMNGDKPGKDLISSMQSRQNAVNTARERINDELSKSMQAPNPLTAANTFASLYKQMRPNQSTANKTTTTTGATEFRTASSKQDSSTKWVRPAKDKDLTADLANINANLQTQIDDIIVQVINNYGA
jgi:hypothetical protein